jgi:transcriptional regulator with XRE-family HTH domain
MAKSFGNVLRHCRGSAGLSQMALALEAGISARHLSFLESGRAAPGRGVVAKLAAALRLAETARNALFASAGFAPLPGREEDRPERAEALARLIQNFDPHPSALAGPGGRICVVNRGMQALHAALTGSHAELGGMTAAELALGPSGLGPFLTNRDELARRFTHCNAAGLDSWRRLGRVGSVGRPAGAEQNALRRRLRRTRLRSCRAFGGTAVPGWAAVVPHLHDGAVRSRDRSGAHSNNPTP